MFSVFRRQASPRFKLKRTKYHKWIEACSFALKFGLKRHSMVTFWTVSTPSLVLCLSWQFLRLVSESGYTLKY
jgi:hypothetical protein